MIDWQLLIKKIALSNISSMLKEGYMNNNINNNYFCPYCGDQLTSHVDIENEHSYYKEYGICSHWDISNQINEF